MNIDATEGAEEDSYRFNPWRAPGHAPVVDAWSVYSYRAHPFAKVSWPLRQKCHFRFVLRCTIAVGWRVVNYRSRRSVA